jgi:hypothetical protein
MPKLEGVKEQRHQPFWDTLIRAPGNTAPTPPVASLSRLFATSNIGNFGLTNMKSAGVLSSDQTFVVLSMRSWLYFRGPQAGDMYGGCASQLFFTLEIGDKPFFQMGCWYFPSGGGVAGFDPGNPSLNSGTPDHRGILKLAQPIPIPARQGFAVIAEFYPIGAGPLPASDVRANLLNASTNIGDRVIQFVLDGLHSRDVL